MKFVVERSLLLDALQRTARIAVRPSDKNLVAILTHVKLETRKPSGLRLTAHDLFREVEILVPTADISKTGVTTMSARALLDFVASCPEGAQVEIEHPRADARVVVRAGRARATLPALSADDFPAFTVPGNAVSFEIEGAAYSAGLASVAHAQSSEETRYYLNGIFVHRRKERELVCVATDGHRIARTIVPMAEDLPEDLPGVIVPSAAIGELIGLAGKVDTLQIEVSDQFLRARTESVTFTTKLVDGTYPDYERVLPPDDVATGFDTDRTAFAQTARRCAAIVSDKARAVKLTPRGDTLELLGSDRDLGEIVDEIDAATSTKMPVGLNTKYLVAALEALQGKTVKVRYDNPGAPIAFTDPGEPNRLQVVMAMRV